MTKKEQTIKVSTPVNGHDIVLKKWIKGRDREYIDEPIQNFNVKTDLRSGGFKAEDMNMGEVLKEQKHRQIETFVISVDGDKEDVVEKVLDMHEKDYNFVRETIRNLSDADRAEEPKDEQAEKDEKKKSDKSQ